MNLMRVLFTVFMAIYILPLNANKRTIDMVPLVIEPRSGDTLFSPSEIDVVLAVVNAGPDTVYPGDMFTLYYKYGGVLTEWEFHSFKETISVGDTFWYRAKFKSEFRISVDHVDFCADFKIWNTTTHGIEPETGAAKENNRACTPTTHVDQYPTLGIQHERLNPNITFYPNPAVDFVQVYIPRTDKNSEGIWKVDFYTNLGQLLHTSVFISGERNELSLVNYPNGIYYIGVKNEIQNMSVFKKLIIQR